MFQNHPLSTINGMFQNPKATKLQSWGFPNFFDQNGGWPRGISLIIFL
jgi:hypothetical protein